MVSKNKNRSGVSDEILYAKFSDGWDFSPDAGNSYSRAEVFTPKYVVDVMVEQLGLFAVDAVRNNDYSTFSDDEAERAVKASIVEPAVGTANFLSEVLHHKLGYAYELTLRDPNLSFDVLSTEALSSVYANDIDCGNLQTAKMRLLYGGSIDVASMSVFWSSQFLKHAGFDPDSKTVETFEDSLAAASKKWGSFLQGDGVMSKSYMKFTGVEPADKLKEVWSDIVDRNFLLFDSITEHTVNSVPGWGGISWRIHEVSHGSDGVEVESRPIAVKLQLGLAELEQLNLLTEELTKPEDSRKLNNLKKKISGLKHSLSNLPGADMPAVKQQLI